MGLRGLILAVADPAAGSTEEAALGLTAVVAGLATAVLGISALIYAQVKNLWRFAPTWFRIAASAIIVVAIGATGLLHS